MSTSTVAYTGSVHTWGSAELPFEVRFCAQCGDLLPDGICKRCGGNFCPFCGATQECSHRLPRIVFEWLPYLAEEREELATVEAASPGATGRRHDGCIVVNKLAQDVEQDAQVRVALGELRRKHPTLWDALLGGFNLMDIYREVWPSAAIAARAALCCVTVRENDVTLGLGWGSEWYAPEPDRIVAAALELLAPWNEAMRNINDAACSRTSWMRCPYCNFVDPRGHGDGLLYCIVCGAWETPCCGIMPPHTYGMACEHAFAVSINGSVKLLAIDPRPLPRSRIDDDFAWELDDRIVEEVLGPYTPLISEVYDYPFVSGTPYLSLVVELARLDRGVFRFLSFGYLDTRLEVVLCEDIAQGKARVHEMLEDMRQRFARLDALFPEHIVEEGN